MAIPVLFFPEMPVSGHKKGRKAFPAIYGQPAYLLNKIDKQGKNDYPHHHQHPQDTNQHRNDIYDTADLLNTGIPEKYSLETEISPDAETAAIECDPRLISRAVGNLGQNSIRHNPQGCTISLRLACPDTAILLSVADDGVGLSAEKLRELEEKPHYMESTDERLDLRHGLGLLLVRQIAEAHGGTMKMESAPQNGYKTILVFQGC